MPEHPPDTKEAPLTLLHGWGRTPVSAATVLAPCNVMALKREVACRDTARPLLARGLGRSYGDASLNAGGTVLDATGVNGILGVDVEGRTVTAEAGVSFDTLIRALLPFGLFVPVTAGTRFITVGGAIAADIHGKNHHADGSIQRHVRELEIVTPGGQALQVSRESHPDVFAATLGGLGLTGVITRATLALISVESGFMSVDSERTPDLETTMERMLESDDRYRYSVAWTDSLARGKSLGRSVLMRANHATRDQLEGRAARSPMAFRDGLLRAIYPTWGPGGVVTKLTVGAFNEAYYRRAPQRREGHIEPIGTYFHPLDGIHHWNRAYGRRGFVQYQFVVPYGEERALREVMELLAEHRCPSLVTVLKRFGAGEGMLSFPMPGWTLAVDIPSGLSGLAELLDRCDRIVVKAGGRIYLAKDARLRPELVPEMYPELPRWRAVCQSLDPEGVMQSDLSRRLELR